MRGYKAICSQLLIIETIVDSSGTWSIGYGTPKIVRGTPISHTGTFSPVSFPDWKRGVSYDLVSVSNRKHNR